MNLFLFERHCSKQRLIGNHDVSAFHEGAVFEKTGDIGRELEAYALIEKFRQQFAQGSVRVCFPFVIDSTPNSLTTISPPLFNFGGEYGKPYIHYFFYLQALEKIRRTIDPETLVSRSYDYEKVDYFEQFIKATFDEIAHSGVLPITREELVETLQLTQSAVDGLRLLPGHGDAHNENYSVCFVNGLPIVSFIDLDTLGLFRRGWDEGRAFAKLNGHEKDQAAFLQALQCFNHFSQEEYICFWRVVTTRSLRRISWLLQGRGKYSRLSNDERKHFISCNVRSALEALKEIIQLTQ